MISNALTEQEEIIEYVKNALNEINESPTKKEKDYHLFNLLAYLISSSNDIAQKGDFYEAAGRLLSAGYYLEEYYPKESLEVYSRANDYYIEYFTLKMKKGVINEAVNIALKIATIFREKLRDKMNEKKYLEIAIDLISDQIILLEPLGPSREIASKHQTLSIIYAKMENWEALITSASKAMEISKSIPDYSIIANSYKDLTNAYTKLNNPKKAQTSLYEALDYFSKEAQIKQDNDEYIQLSQIYQIIKSLYGMLRDQKKFQLFSRKEAGVYIALAKLGLLYNNSDAQIASYYRGAALCYLETNQNDLDSASCFLLAGNYYLDGKKHLEAALNFEDAAKIFEHLGKYRKAYSLYIMAADNAARSNTLQPAIENYMWAHQIAIKEHFKVNEILAQLFKYLMILARVEQDAQNHFIAGTLFLEAAKFKIQIPGNFFNTIKDLLDLSNKNYKMAIDSPTELKKRSTKAYVLTLIAILSNVLQDKPEMERALQQIQMLNSETGKLYSILANHVLEQIQSGKFSNLDANNKKLAKLLEHGEEIRIILDLLKNPNH